jgi:hypothetical protein
LTQVSGRIYDIYQSIILLHLKMFFDKYEKYLAMIEAEEDYRTKAELAYTMHVVYANSRCMFCSRKKRIERVKKFLDLYYEYMHCC